MFENPRRGRQARNFTTSVPKILDLKSSSEQIFSENCRWVPLTRPAFPPSDRYLVSNLKLWETKHVINLPARLYLDRSVPKRKLNGQNEWALFNVSNSLLRKVLLLKLCVLISKSVDAEDYSSITFFHIFEGLFVPLVWIAVIPSHTNTKK